MAEAGQGLRLLEEPTRFLLFTGKGGVGKTSLACATAVALADRGLRVLLVSTDPASNLDEVLGIRLSGAPRAVPGVPGLDAYNIDPEAAATEYRERAVGPFRSLLPKEAVARMEEELSGACTVEIAAFDRFARLLGDPAAAAAYDHVILDTAPTGHTLRLLALPSAWEGFLQANQTGTSCIGPLAALGEQRALYGAAVAALGDRSRTSVVLVTRPERSAVDEAARTSAELRDLSIAGLRLLVNGVFRPTGEGDALASAIARQGASALEALPGELRDLPRDEMPLVGYDLVGAEALRRFASGKPAPAGTGGPERAGRASATLAGLSTLVDEISAEGHGLVMVMGKGGVGKTTVAAAVAVELARRGRKVHLSTTDPAAHVLSTVGRAVGNLSLGRIDPAAATRAYVEHVLATSGAGLDAGARALLEEDLRSPCTQEIAVFQAFSRTVAEAKRGFVVLDTAPTGHTLMLLDATGSYHRDVMRNAASAPGRLVTPLMRLQDPSYTKVVVVALAETTPIQEAERLQADLRRAGIEPWAFILNRSLAAAGPSDPVLRARARLELPHIDRVRREVASRVTVLPWLADAPVGPALLRALASRAASPEEASCPSPRVLILCTGNSCRSQIGEGWVRHDLGERVEVHSAGTHPSSVHPLAIRVMREAGVDISRHASKSVAEVRGPFDLVVTVCDAAREACPVLPGARRIVHCSFEDPALAGNREEALPVFRRVRDEIRAALVPLVETELRLPGSRGFA